MKYKGSVNGVLLKAAAWCLFGLRPSPSIVFIYFIYLSLECQKKSDHIKNIIIGQEIHINLYKIQIKKSLILFEFKISVVKSKYLKFLLLKVNRLFTSYLLKF